MADDETGELLVERRLDHENGEAAKFYHSLQKPVRVGIEATGPIHWFVRLLAELGHELWIGDSAKIRASEVRKQKTDERDARLILDLLLSKRFPKIWVPTPAERTGGPDYFWFFLPRIINPRASIVPPSLLTTNTEGAPPSVFEGGSWGFLFLGFSLISSSLSLHKTASIPINPCSPFTHCDQLLHGQSFACFTNLRITGFACM